MNERRVWNPRYGTWLRARLLVLVATAFVVGVWALLAPRSFYEDFPAAGRGWVSSLPFNEHLVRDVGALNLAFAVLLAYAATVLEGKTVHRMEGKEAQEYGPGRVWYEPQDLMHQDLGNDSPDTPAKILGLYHTEPDKPVLVPE